MKSSCAGACTRLLVAAAVLSCLHAAGSLERDGEEGEREPWSACSSEEADGEPCVDPSFTIASTVKRWREYSDLINSSELSYHRDEEGCWSEEGGCGCYNSVIAADLAVWRERGGVQWEEFQAAKALPYRAVHYQVIDHKLYRQESCMFVSRCTGVEHFLLEIIDILPNMEMIINMMDYPLSQTFTKKPLPVFSFSKTSEYYDIMYPAWTFWSGGPAISTEPTGLGRWDLKRESIPRAAEQWPWEKKKPIGFFRGSRTSAQRDPLILLSREKPQLVNAAYTKNQAWKSEQDTLGAPAANIIPLEDHCEYKYLFNFRGVTASFRLKHLFLCRSLVLHVGDKWLEFFYPLLRPWVHYVPVKEDLSDAEDLLDFVKGNDHISKEIANRGFEFTWSHLNMATVACYWHKLLTDYAQLTTWTVTRDPTLKLVQ